VLTKLVPSLRCLPYEERVPNLKLPPLFYGKRCVDVIQVFHQPELVGIRGHNEKIHTQRSRLDVNGSLVKWVIATDWNSLKEDVDL
jgi:hypothetical protein